MNTSKKLIALLLSLVMLCCLFAGCTGNPTTAPTGATTAPSTSESDSGKRDVGGLQLPLTDEKQELSVWLIYSGTIMTDLNEIEGVKAMEENTNVHINWIPNEQNTVQEKYGILISSGEYPDIIYSMPYPGGYAKGIADDVIYADMDSMIRNYMPNYMALINSSDEARREATSDDGKMQVVRIIVGTDKTAQSEGTYMGLGYRADLLEKLGKDVPTTVDEWHDVLVAAKEYGIEAPFNLDTNGGSPISLAWGINTDAMGYMLQLNGDTITCGAAEDGFEGYLNTMRQWYSEGLINPNFTSFNFYLDTPPSVNANQSLLYSRILSAFTGNNYARFRMVTDQPDEFIQAIPAPLLKEGDKPIQCANRIIAKEGIYISTSCQNPELAAKWLDYQYSEEGSYLNWYGIEGETYDLDADGIPQFKEIVFKNDSGLSTNDFLSKYALNWGKSWLGKHNVSASWKVSTTAAGGQNQELDSVAIWSEPETNIFLTQSITLTEEEGDEANAKITALYTMMTEYTVNYIIGQEDKTYQQFREELFQYGMQDVIDIYQAAYERYLAR